MDEKKVLYARIRQQDKHIYYLLSVIEELEMKIEMVGDIVDQPDGSGLVELDTDEEGRQYLMQLGFEVILRRGMDSLKKEQPISHSCRSDGVCKCEQPTKEEILGKVFDAVYAQYPNKEWQRLSDAELFILSQQCDLNHILGLIDYGRTIEAKLKEKNA